MSSPDKLTIETPEQTWLEFPLAGIGSRFLAFAADTVLQVLLALIVLAAAAVVHPLGRFVGKQAPQWFMAGLIICIFLINAAYFAFFEAIWNGQTPGKRWTRLRVMKEDGRPISAYEALARNLLRIVDSLPAMYAIGILSILISKQNKRLGDYVAGTVVVHERPLESVRPSWPSTEKVNAAAYDASQVSLEELQLLETFLHRREGLEQSVRRHMASEIAERLGNKIGVSRESRLHSERFLETLAEQLRNARHYR